jgi:hypothetical protein
MYPYPSGPGNSVADADETIMKIKAVTSPKAALKDPKFLCLFIIDFLLSL